MNLWNLTVQDNIVRSDLFLQGPVSYWDFKSDGEVLVQLQTGNYQIVDSRGEVVRELGNLDEFLFGTSTDQIIDIDW